MWLAVVAGPWLACCEGGKGEGWGEKSFNPPSEPSLPYFALPPTKIIRYIEIVRLREGEGVKESLNIYIYIYIYTHIYMCCVYVESENYDSAETA